MKPCAGRTAAPEPAAFRAVETNLAFEFRTSYLEIKVRKNDGGLMVKSRHGVEMLDEIVKPGIAPAGLHFERRAPEGERLYGLGPRTDAELDLRGKVVSTERPLLISTLGYGVWFTASTNYRFDLASTSRGRVSVHAAFPDRLEFFFHYGPTPKEILEEHFAVAGWTFGPTPAQAAVLPGEAGVPRFATKAPAMPWADLLRWMAHASMSGILVPAVEQTRVASQAVAPLLPMLYGGEETPQERAALAPYLYTYLTEAKDRGFPLFRPMAMQYPKDTIAAARLDQFMLGDEILAAAGPDVYLPMGIWTDLRSGVSYPGKQVIAVAPGTGAPVFAKNGTILPLLQPDGAIELHYFPRLGAEFFLSEPGQVQPSQVHAGPAAGVLRLEIESRVDRRYEWVVHHVGAASAIEPAPVKGRYDPARRVLRIPVETKAMADSIVNVTLETPLEP